MRELITLGLSLVVLNPNPFNRFSRHLTYTLHNHHSTRRKAHKQNTLISGPSSRLSFARIGSSQEHAFSMTAAHSLMELMSLTRSLMCPRTIRPSCASASMRNYTALMVLDASSSTLNRISRVLQLPRLPYLPNPLKPISASPLPFLQRSNSLEVASHRRPQLLLSSPRLAPYLNRLSMEANLLRILCSPLPTRPPANA
jgi:hypothetical protein